MRAYYYDNLPGHQSEEHDSGREVTIEQLAALGIKAYHFETVEEVDQLAKERNYKNRDVVNIAPTSLPNYEEKIKAFFSEHIHEDEEIRYILDGSGYFDVRSKGDDWIRIALEKYDLMIMPPGIYHRFTTDTKNYIKAMRLFQDDPKWTPLNRGDETDSNSFRQEYLKSLDNAAAPVPASA